MGQLITHIPIYASQTHDDVIKWKHFPRYLPFVRGIHRSPVNSPHKGQWRWVLIFSLICVWINGWVNNREAGDYDVIVMTYLYLIALSSNIRFLPNQKLLMNHNADHIHDTCHVIGTMSTIVEMIRHARCTVTDVRCTVQYTVNIP